MTHTKPLPQDRAELVFEDYKAPYSAQQAVAEANRCLYCSDAPCIQACPTSINIPEFIRRIGSGNTWGSAKTIFESNILGMSCARVCPVEVLCVGDCVFNHLDSPPIQIGRLQRFATDEAFARGWRFFEAGPPTGKKVALIGAGPASLACAHELRRHGHAVTIFEKRSQLGGLNTGGVAPYKMKADRSLDEVDWVLGIGGIDMKPGVDVGRTITLEQLEKDHDAVFVGVGLGADTPLKVPGENLAGVFGAVDWIERMKLNPTDLRGVTHAVVVGGGNTAIDAVREALGLGIPNVSMVYRGTLEKMSGYAHEWKAAQVDGARAEWQTLPLRLEGNGKVERVVCTRVDADKKPLPGSGFSMDAQLVLLAIGQSKLVQLLTTLPGITADGGKLKTDEHGFTGRKGWYAGGDVRNGGKEVVNAAAEGKAAALAIHKQLAGGTHA